jgi:iron complex outermembrane receptor protein
MRGNEPLTLMVCAVALAMTSNAKDARAAEGQAAAADISAGLDEIIVTARKRPENIQAVPIAMTAFSAGDLERKNIGTLADLRFVTPSLSVQPDTFRQDTINVTIRGLRNFPSNGIQFDTAAAIYVNGVYIARAQGLTGAWVDVDSVQVLKGPQGTLVGRNATGGALLYTTREPGDDFGGSLTVTGGAYGRAEAQGIVNVPFSDRIAARAVFSYAETAGYLKNTFVNPATGERNDTPGLGSRKTAGLFSLKVEPDDTTKLLFRGDFDAEHHTGSSYHLMGAFEGTVSSTGNVGSNPTPVSRPSICQIPTTCGQLVDLKGRVIDPYFSDATTRTVNTSPAAYNSLLNVLARESRDFWSIEQADSAYNTGHFQSVSATADKSFGDVKVKLLGGYRWTDTAGVSVSRGAPYATTEYIYVDPGYKAYTAELTLNGKLLDNRLDWTTGGFFFSESVPNAGSFYYLFSANQLRPQAVAGRQVTLTDSTGNSGKNTSYAGYAQATYNILPQLRMTGGLRYTVDARAAHIAQTSTRFPATAATTAAVANSVFDPGTYVLNGISYTGVTRSCALTDANGALRPVNDCFFDVRRTFRKPTWTISLDYDLFDRTLVYVTSRKGYKAGAINSGATNAAVTVAQPENVQDYEAGIKSDWFLGNMPLRTNFAAYLTNYRDIQVQVGLPYVVFAAGPGGGSCSQSVFNAGQCTGATTDSVTLNAKAAQIYGGEWDISLKPTPDFTLSWNGSVMHAKYTDFTFAPPAGYLQPATGASLTGQSFPLPAWNTSAAATYALTGEQMSLPISEASLTASAYYQSDYKTDLTGYNPAQKTKGYALANLRLSFDEIKGQPVNLSATVTNIFNTQACLAEPGGTGAGGGAGVLTSTPNATFGTPNTSGIIQCVPLPPRMFAVTMKYTF